MNYKTKDIFRQAITEIFDQYPEDNKEINKMYVPDPFVEVFTKRILEKSLIITKNAIDNGITDPAHIEKIVKQYFGIV